MSLIRGNNKIISRTVYTPINSSTYVRPTEWFTLPEVNEGDNKLVALFGVYNHDSNFASVNATVTGGYTVNWGNGVITTAATNIQSNYIYNSTTYASLSAQTAFREYKQVIVQIYPTVSGNNWTAVSVNKKHPNTPNDVRYAWLDVKVAGSGITSADVVANSSIYVCSTLEQFSFVGTNNISDFSNMFRNCYNLQTILLNTSKGTNFSNMFKTCLILQSTSLFNTSSGINFTSMFENCFALQTIPLFNTSSGAIFTNMFYSCYSLQTIPLFDTSSGTTFTSMFVGCYSLQTIPLFNTSSGTTFTNMFQYCYSLAKGTLYGTTRAISYTGCKLAKDEIVDIFNNLGTATTQTITVSNNWGYASLTAGDRLIATSKGWTIN